MKNVSLKKQFFFLVILALAFSACKKTDIPMPVADAAIVTLDSVSLDDPEETLSLISKPVGTYYISPLGSNLTGDGTSGKPWKTLYKATANVTNAGSKIHVNAGTYTETRQCNLAAGVSIEGDGSATTIIKSTLIGQWSVFLSLESPQDANGNQSISGVTLDGRYVSETNNKTWIGIWVTGRSNVIIHHTIIIGGSKTGSVFDWK